MREERHWTRRAFLAFTGAAVGAAAAGRFTANSVMAASVTTPHADIAALCGRTSSTRRCASRCTGPRCSPRSSRRRKTEPWIVRKALALREYFQTVPLYLREHDRLAGSISELPGAMPVMVELGIGENNIYTSERPDREGYLKGQVPDEIRDYWKNRNMWGLYRTEILGQTARTNRADEVPAACSATSSSPTRGISARATANCCGSASAGCWRQVADASRRARRDADKLGVPHGRRSSRWPGLSAWIGRYAEFLGRRGETCDQASRAAELREMARIAAKVADAAARDVPRGAAADLVRPSGDPHRGPRLLLHARPASTSCCCRSTKPTARRAGSTTPRSCGSPRTSCSRCTTTPSGARSII